MLTQERRHCSWESSRCCEKEASLGLQGECESSRGHASKTDIHQNEMNTSVKTKPTVKKKKM